MDTLNILISIFLILISLDLIFMVTLHYFHDRSGYYKYAALIWLGMLMGMISDTLAYPYGLHHVFGGPFLCTPAFFYGLLISKLYSEIRVPLRNLVILSVVGWVIGALMHFAFDAPFWLSALFFIAGGAFAYIYTGFQLWSGFNKGGILEKMYASALILEGVHLLDYPFLRNLDDRVMITQFGFGFAIILVYFASILNPVLINKKISSNLNSILKRKVDEKVLELQSVNALLQENRKMAALGEMAGGIAHEINTPVGTILLRANQTDRLLGQNPPNIAKAQEFSRSIVDVCERITRIITGLRSFARSGSKDPFEIKKVKSIIEDTLDLYSERLKNHEIELTIKGFSDEISVDCRPQQISQVLLNLLVNAKHAVTKGCSAKWITIDVKESGGEVSIIVTDSGPGVPESIRSKILEPFFTTKDLDEGTGLGLSISKGIVEDHNGKLFLDDSRENTTFVIQIPAIQTSRNKVA